jgi:hypothetical protein
MSINALRSLGDDQLNMIAQKVKQGDTSVLQSLGMFSAAPVIGELMRRSQIRNAARAQMAQQKQPTIADEALASVSGVGALPVEDVMEERNFAGGGIVAFSKGGSSGGFDYSNPYGVPEEILRGVHGAESNFSNPKYMVSPKGAIGPFQFTESTGKEYGLMSEEDRRDFPKSLNAAAKYLARLHNQYDNWTDAVTAYNWGPGNMSAYKKTGKGLRGLERPAESLNYPAAVQKHMGSNAALLNRYGIRGPGRNERFPVETVEAAQAPAEAGMDYTSMLKKAGEDYEANKKANEEFYSKEMEGIKAPEEIDQEGIRAAYMDRFKQFSDPMFQELRGLLEQQRPDSEAARRTNFNNALMTAGLAMMGTPGGLGRAISSGGLRGLAQYAEGEEDIQKQNRDFLNATIKSKQYEFNLAKEAVESAEDAVKNAVREYGIDSRVAQKAMADLRQAKFNANKLAYQERALVERGINQERMEQGRNERNTAALTSREGIAAGRQGAKEGQEAGKEAKRDETALQKAYDAALKDDDGYRKYRAERIKAGYKDQIKSKEEWAREVAPSRIYKNQPSTQEQAPAAVSGGNKTLKLFE